jgi:lipopolysaccharide biosynthesis protein
MVAWANENWTRTWDGGESEVLLAQQHSLADDAAHLRALAPALRDSRYIRVDGRPVVLIYRPSLLPDIRATLETWRTEAQREGLGELYIGRIDSHEPVIEDPSKYGFDAAVEFQPDINHFGDKYLRGLPIRVFNRLFRPHSGLRHHDIFRYESLVRNALSSDPLSFYRYPCVTPGWDNSPRRREWSRIFVGSSPGLYAEWLKGTVDRFKPRSPEENFVFINAWNEWAEGNHLEPDQRWGRAYLEATADVFCGT